MITARFLRLSLFMDKKMQGVPGDDIGKGWLVPQERST
jgi:hypothetical protein